jgi:hypothetical protein
MCDEFGGFALHCLLVGTSLAGRSRATGFAMWTSDRGGVKFCMQDGAHSLLQWRRSPKCNLSQAPVSRSMH